MEFITLSNHPMFHTLQRPLLQHRLLQKVTAIALAIKGRIPAIMKESQLAHHSIIETHMTRTVNESSPGIYTLGGGYERGQATTKKKEKEKIHNQASH